MSADQAADAALSARLRAAPIAVMDARIAAELAGLKQTAAQDSTLAGLAAMLEQDRVAKLLAGTLTGSPYLSGLILRDLPRLQRVLGSSPERRLADLEDELDRSVAVAASMADAMRLLREFKAEVALGSALADLGGVWPVMQVTAALTDAADAALRTAVRYLFRQAATRGEWLPPDPERPAEHSGYIVLAMGKYGAGELNYSSDIDLIVFYEPERLRLKEGLEAPAFFVRLTRDLVRMMEERTGAGYVFRVDLRLRPDAGATQVALSTDAGLIYYESFGQNWERAALIKARAAAGDIEAGEQFLEELAPFVWRKYLDFAAIADIHAMKRQIHAYRGFGTIAVAGHDVKLGRGGIREIEFFVQTQQLIAGGRQRHLRVRQTLEALRALAALQWIKPDIVSELTDAYLFLRTIEHRIQMVADEQTHELPSDQASLLRLARFAGFESIDALSERLIGVLETVQGHYSALFEDMPQLTAGGANMVFAGEQDDPATLEALKKLGYAQPAQVLATVRGWHHGRYPAVRSPKAREALTVMQPLLIEALANTADPGGAFARFDRFLAELPSGVQLFALLKAHPGLLRLIADMMGTAPRLAGILSRRRRLLDAVLDPRALGALPTPQDIDRLIASECGTAADFQEVLDRARVVGSEQMFLVGLRVLTGSINANQAGGAYALIAERLIAALQAAVEAEMVRSNGKVPGGAAAVIAMGKLGGREMTATSDLDLIVVYDYAPAAVMSAGLKPLAPSQYYARLTQRLIAALSAQTAEGTLYEVDMRLRPSGQKGPVAAQLASFIDYQMTEAWTWEHMALTRARVVTGPPHLVEKVEAAIRRALVSPRDAAKISTDVRDMRQRIAAEKGTDQIWELKQVRGGLVDIEFIVQYLQLVHAAAAPDVLDQNTLAAVQKLHARGAMEADAADILARASRLYNALTQILRLCLEGPFDPASAPEGLKQRLAEAGDEPTFAALEERLRLTLAAVADLFPRMISAP